MLCPLAVLCVAWPLWAGQAAAPLRVPAGPRPVEDLTEPPKVSDISLGDFQFQETTFLHAGPGLFRIDGEPVIGTRYVVEAHLYGDEAIATMRFEAVDENGLPIEPPAIARIPGPMGSSRFVGLMTVPANPFRIVLSGVGIDGQPFRRTQRSPFKPVYRAPSPQQRFLELESGEANAVQRIINEASPRLIAEVEADLAASPPGPIVMPRMQVSNVTYAALLSAQGRPIGLRIAYDVKFSESGQYDPDVRAEAAYSQPKWHRLTRMRVLTGSITPMPREAYPPYGDLTFGELSSSPLESGAHYTFEGGTVYHFTANLVPNYAVHSLDKSRSCIYYREFRYSPGSQQGFAQVLANMMPTEYTVSIGRTAFKGRIQNFYGEGTFHQSFVAEGAQDCGDQPTRRF